ncbi:PREDICTED: zinc finger BED domain-containing protein 4-like [Trachymyrmex cornetzi]|uniref:zinc finger BED domain-containing protein 4-like n=1 Tax=Trachymyrmex cornetzi TaxID=471704 RepID=UPI00084F8116|nr:PREDICTED: zinc finger BED domain-containing protein 4-like [Trachymyrmex cornetzi]
MVTSIDEESEELDSVSELSTSTSMQSQELSSCTSMCTSERKISVCSTSKNPLPKFQIQPSIDKAFHKIETYRDKQPFSMVEDDEFRKFLSIVAPLYTVPCRKTITKRLDEKYELLSSKIRTMLSKIDHLCLATDIWTEPFNTRSYIGITVQIINFETMQLENLSLGIKELEESHDGNYISKIISEILDEWHIQINSVVAVITDNASNIKKAVRDTFGRKRHIPCFAHTLNLVIQDAIATTPEFQAIVKKVKSIVTYFKRSVKATNALNELQTSNLENDQNILKLKQGCETHWNSLFYMIKRFIQLANLVNTVLLTLPRKKHDDIPEMTTHTDLQILKDICAILRPVERVTTEISGELYVTCSKIIPIISCLIRTLEKLDITHEISERFYKNVLLQLQNRFRGKDSNNETNSFLSISTLLDPRFKKLHFSSSLAVSTAISKIFQLMKNNQIETQCNVEENINIPRKEDLWNIHDELIASSSLNSDEPGGIPVELRQFLNANVVSRSEDPFKIWQKLKDVYPMVYEVAMKYFVIVGTSVPSERLFSAAGNIISMKRSRIKGKRASQIIFLGSLLKRYWK